MTGRKPPLITVPSGGVMFTIAAPALNSDARATAASDRMTKVKKLGSFMGVESQRSDRRSASRCATNLVANFPKTEPSGTSCLAMKSLFLAPLFALALAAHAQEAKPLRAGVIGLDTSHVLAFTQTLNKGPRKPEDADKVAGVKMAAAYPPGSKDIESSTTRVPEYTEKVKALGVEIVDSVDELVKRVDAVFLETNDGRVHLEQVKPV